MSGEFHFVGHFRLRKFPWIAIPQPFISHFHLFTFFQALFKHAKFITNAVANGRHLQRCHRIKITGGQPSQSAIAKPGFFFLVKQLIKIQPKRYYGFLHFILQAQVDQGVAEVRADEEFSRQVSDYFFFRVVELF